MGKQALKIQIKLQNQRPTPVITESKPPFSKGKIAAAVVGLSALMTGLVHAFSDPEPTIAQANPPSIDNPADRDFPANELNKTVLVAYDESVSEAESNVAAEDVNTESTAGENVNQSEADVVTTEAETSADAAVIEEPVVDNTANVEPSETEESSVENTAESEATETAEAQTEETVEEDVSVIKRNVLAYAIDNKEPANIAKSRIDAQTQTFKLFLFNELNGYQGKSVTHRWIWKEKVVSEVKLKVDAPNWRTWSSKRILWRWQGDWRIEVLDDLGNILDTKKFRYGV